MNELQKIKLMSRPFLFAMPGLFSGMSSVFNLSGDFTDYNTSPSPEIADIMAFKSDLRAIGGDFVATAITFKPRV